MYHAKRQIFYQAICSGFALASLVTLISHTVSCGRTPEKGTSDEIRNENKNALDLTKVGTWQKISSENAPEPRYLYERHTIITSDELVVFGGYNSENEAFLDGGIYNFKRDSWQKIKALPEKRESYSMAWGNGKLLVWGGSKEGSPTLSSGWLYDTKTEQWAPTPSGGAPAPRYLTPAYTVRDKVVIWGGHPNCDKIDGAIFDLTTQSWTPMAKAPVSITAGCWNQFWTGDRLTVWGGYSEAEGATFSGGAIFDVTSNSWQEISQTGAPTEREWPLLLASKDTLLVWGGRPKGDWKNEHPIHDGALYDFASGTWVAIADASNTVPTLDPKGIFIDNDKVFLWGGPKGVYVPSEISNRGGILDIKSKSWSFTSVQDAPSSRVPHILATAGNTPFIWGANCLNDGARFDLKSNSWTGISAQHTPEPRRYAAQAWNGDLILMWGGKPCNQEKEVFGDGYLLRPF